MDEKTQNGYIACVIFLVVSLLSGFFAIQNEFNISGQLLWIITFVSAVFGVLSFRYPTSFGQIAWRILKYLKKNFVDEKSDSHVYQPQSQLQQNSSGSVQAMSKHGNISISMNSKEKVTSKDLEVYSVIHSMIVRINKKVSRKVALQLTGVGAWVEASGIDFNSISKLFNQHMDIFREEDLQMWLDIEDELKTRNSFYLNKDRQEWFDYLEAEYKRRKT